MKDDRDIVMRYEIYSLSFHDSFHNASLTPNNGSTNWAPTSGVITPTSRVLTPVTR